VTTTTYTASEARSKLYSLIREAAKGLKAFEIKLRGSEPVVLMSKEELESWQETLDILSNPEEVKAINKARKSKKFISHEQVLKKLG
jgi:prevent-host-death family protein